MPSTTQNAQADEPEQPAGFEAIIEADTLESFIDIQLALVDEAKWHIEDDGLHVSAVDPANVAMYDWVDLSAEAFEAYDAGDGGGVIGINLTGLWDYVTSKIAGDIIHLSLDAETRKLVVDVGPTAYTMTLIDPRSIRREPDTPDLNLPAEFGIDGATFVNAIDAAGLVSDHVELRADPDARTFHIDASGDTDDAETAFGDDELLAADTGPTEVASLYSLGYLDELTGPIPSEAAVRIELGQEFPVRMAYKAADEHIDVRAAVAPRIRNS